MSALAAAASLAAKGAGASEVLDKVRANQASMLKGAVGSAVESSPYGVIALRIVDLLDGLLSAKFNIDLPNGQQTLTFIDRMVTNFGTLTACYAYDWSRSDSYARQKTTLLIWQLTDGWPCDSRIGLCYAVCAGGFPGKKAGSSAVRYWRSRWQPLTEGKTAPFYSVYDLKTGHGVPSSLKYCKGGLVAQELDPKQVENKAKLKGLEAAISLYYERGPFGSPAITRTVEQTARAAAAEKQAQNAQVATAVGAGALLWGLS